MHRRERKCGLSCEWHVCGSRSSVCVVWIRCELFVAVHQISLFGVCIDACPAANDIICTADGEPAMTRCVVPWAQSHTAWAGVAVWPRCAVTTQICHSCCSHAHLTQRHCGPGSELPRRRPHCLQELQLVRVQQRGSPRLVCYRANELLACAAEHDRVLHPVCLGPACDDECGQHLLGTDRCHSLAGTKHCLVRACMRGSRPPPSVLTPVCSPCTCVCVCVSVCVCVFLMDLCVSVFV